jgi:ABC-type transport system substrate-binding protein
MAASEELYTIGIPEYWQTLMPPLQHSLSGFGVMINQFEPLVRRGRKGLLEPLAAKSWEFSEDRLTLRFNIETSRKFSDGSPLCAADFKRSWEDGLRMQSKSKNSSLADALTNLKGFGELSDKGEISGLRAVGNDVLELEFEKPVRSVLEHLSGVRYSAYKAAAGGVQGTGPYVISETDKVLTLVPNKYYPGPSPKLRNVKIIAVSPADAEARLRDGKIDALLFAESAKNLNCDPGKNDPVQCAFGQEGTHTLVIVNGMKGRFFSSAKHRLALQALLAKRFDCPPEEWPVRGKGFSYDPQSFLTFQAGRLPDKEAKAIVLSGEKYIPQLQAESQRHPLKLSYRLGWLADYLEKSGIKLEGGRKESLESKEWLEMVYKTFEPDLMPITGSVYDGDPDCLYHMLGRHGAIFSPMLERAGVADGLEAGRKLTDLNALPHHYQEVAKDILNEVPYIHLGFYYRGVAYNKTRLKINETFVGRNNQSITIFEPN